VVHRLHRPHRRRRTAKGFTDKAETERLAAQLEDDARLIRQGLKEPDNELLAEHKHAPISSHVEEFEKHLRNRDITNKQVAETISRLNRMISDCGFDSVADMKSHDIEAFLGELRASGKSKQTSNISSRPSSSSVAGWFVPSEAITTPWLTFGV
jgi:phosphoenolpyruvate carboxylase